MRVVDIGLGKCLDLDWDERQGARTATRTHINAVADWGVVDQTNTTEILVDNGEIFAVSSARELRARLKVVRLV